MCAERRLRSACASAMSDQTIIVHKSAFLTIQNMPSDDSECSDWSESSHMSEGAVSDVAAHLINSFVAKFQTTFHTTFVVCFFVVVVFFLTNYRFERNLYAGLKLKDWMSNSVDPDETAHYETSHLYLCYLQKTIIIACGSERVDTLTSPTKHATRR